jgi:hypothetical protein
MFYFIFLKNKDEEFFEISSSLSPPLDSVDLSDETFLDSEKSEQEEKERRKQPLKMLSNSIETFEISKETFEETSTTSFPESLLSENLKIKTKKSKNTIEIHIPQKNEKYYKIELNVNRRTLGIEMIRNALIQYNKESQKNPIFKDPDGYLLCVGMKKRDGTVVADSDMPMMEKSVPILDLGFDLFLLKCDEKWKEKEIQVLEEDVNYLDYVKVHLIIGNKNRMIQISPDVFLIDLMDCLSQRCNIQKEKVGS